MAEAIRQMTTGMRQLLFPREFRIQSGTGDDPGVAFMLLVQEALERAEEVAAGIDKRLAPLMQQTLERALAARQPDPAMSTSPASPVAATKMPVTVGIDERMACDLCNELFRLRRNLAQMVKEVRESKEMRSIGRAMENVDELLLKRGVEYRDLSETDYDERNIDFQRVGEPEDVPGLDRKKIGVCECPSVTIGGKIAQKAKGVVRRPA